MESEPSALWEHEGAHWFFERQFERSQNSNLFGGGVLQAEGAALSQRSEAELRHCEQNQM